MMLMMSPRIKYPPLPLSANYLGMSQYSARCNRQRSLVYHGKKLDTLLTYQRLQSWARLPSSTIHRYDPHTLRSMRVLYINLVPQFRFFAGALTLVSADSTFPYPFYILGPYIYAVGTPIYHTLSYLRPSVPLPTTIQYNRNWLDLENIPSQVSNLELILNWPWDTGITWIPHGTRNPTSTSR